MKEITLELTNECKNKCLHCSSLASPQKYDELSIDIIKNIISIYNPEWVNLSGGEPLLYSHLIELIQYLKTKNIKIKLYTTGVIDNFNEIINKIYNQIDVIVFPYYSLEETTYNSITNNKNSFKYTNKAIEICLKLNINIEAHIVPMTINLNELDNTIKYLLNLKIKKINILKLVNQGRCYNNQFLILDNYILSNKLKEIKEKYKENIKLGLPFNKCKECVAGKEKLVVMCNGKIIPCESYKDGICKCERLKL